MTVEKMEALSAVGYIDDINFVSEEMVKCGCIHIINATEDIKHNCMRNDKDDCKIIRPYKTNIDFTNLKEHVEEIIEILNMDKVVQKRFINQNISLSEINAIMEPIYKETVKYGYMLQKIREELNKIKELYENIMKIKELKFALSELKNLKFFKFSIGKLNKDYYTKLKENIENIPSIIYKVSSTKEYVVIISFTPKSTIVEAKEIFKSLGLEEIIIQERIKGMPENIIKRLENIIKEKEEKIKRIECEMFSIKKKSGDIIERYFSFLCKIGRIQDINNNAVCTNNTFYITGWIPISKKNGLIKKLETIEDKIILVFRGQSDVKGVYPPTKLTNNSFFKPFEYIVNMYGIPSYSEVDPTSFVAISYMIMFGAMFGDVGQGFVLLATGLYLSMVKNSYDFGGILTRIGLSSIMFGFLYGSVFGNEMLLKPLLLRPLENINTILAGGVILGLILSTISYIYNFINSVKSHELEEGVFGREGAAGFIFYWVILLTGYSIYKYGSIPIPIPIVGTILLILLLLIVLKQPLARLIEGKRPLYHEPIGDYYIESLFGIIETLLGMLSKTISFVRLGAFALNHAGFFIAFVTISNMIKNRVGSIAVLILGNILIIGLEGLVVFIQGLRLEYYEIFSRFYRGNGTLYSPISLTFEKDLPGAAKFKKTK